MKKKKKRGSAGGKKGSRVWAHPAEFRLKVVRLFMEEGYSASLLAEQFGISRSAIRRWNQVISAAWSRGVGAQASQRR